MKTSIPRPKTLVELFENHPERWTKYCLFRDKNGKPVYHDHDPEVTSFCVKGGLMFVCGTDYGWDETEEQYAKRINKEQALYKALGGVFDIADWNDDPNLTFEEFMEVLKKAKV